MDIVASPNPILTGHLSVISSVGVSVSAGPNGCSVVLATGANPQLVLATPHSGGALSITGAPNARIDLSIVEGSLAAPGKPLTLGTSGQSVLNSEVRDGRVVLLLAPGSRTVTCNTG